MKRLTLFWLVFLCPVLCAADGAAQANRLGQVLRRQPNVRGNQKPLNPRDDIYNGMTVETEKRAGAYILIESPKEGWVQMGGSTTLTFNQSVLKGELDLRLSLGRCLAMFWPDDGTGKGLIKIKTDAGVVTLRGTVVYLDVARDGTTFVSVREGLATLESLAGEAVTIHAGQQASVAKGQPPSAPVSGSSGGGSDLGPSGELLDPPLVDLNDPRLDLPK